jgi:hypothetical protein
MFCVAFFEISTPARAGSTVAKSNAATIEIRLIIPLSHEPATNYTLVASSRPSALRTISASGIGDRLGGFAVTVAGHAIPLWASWLGIGIGLLFGIMLLVEARR